jgi:hypothetical protein
MVINSTDDTTPTIIQKRRETTLERGKTIAPTIAEVAIPRK